MARWEFCDRWIAIKADFVKSGSMLNWVDYWVFIVKETCTQTRLSYKLNPSFWLIFESSPFDLTTNKSKVGLYLFSLISITNSHKSYRHWSGIDISTEISAKQPILGIVDTTNHVVTCFALTTKSISFIQKGGKPRNTNQNLFNHQ